jgi:PleD family two-component response regulator
MEDEFAMVLPDTPPGGALTVAARVLECVLALKIEHKGSRTCPWVGISMGIASSGAEDAVAMKDPR